MRTNIRVLAVVVAVVALLSQRCFVADLTFAEVCISVKADFARSKSRSSNFLLESFLDDCIAQGRDNDATTHLSAFIADWMTRQQRSNVSGFSVAKDGNWLPEENLFHGELGSTVALLSAPVSACYTTFSCENKFAEQVVLSFIGDMLMFWHWSFVTSFDGAIASKAALATLADSLPFNVLCLPESGQCCFVFAAQLIADGKVEAKLVYFYDRAGENASRYSWFLGLIRCLSEFSWLQKRQRVEAEACTMVALSLFENSTELEQRRQADACYERRLDAFQLRYRLVYSSFGLLQTMNFLTQTFAAEYCIVDKQAECRATSNSPSKFARSLELRSIVTETFVPVMFLQQSIILALNILLLAAIFKQPRSLQQRPMIFLSNVAISNLAFCAAETIQLILSKTNIRGSCKFFENSDQINLKPIQCCTSHTDIISYVFLIAIADCTNEIHSGLSAFLLLARITAQHATMLNFVAFGLFQLLPLIWPFDPPRLLEYPKSTVGLLWILGGLISVTTNVLTIADYKAMQRQELDSYAVGNTLSITEPSSRSELNEQAAHVAIGSLFELTAVAAFLLCGQISYAFILGMVWRLSGANHDLQAGQNVQSMRDQTRKSLITISIAMVAMLISAVPSLYLQIVAYVSSTRAQIESYSDSDFYGNETLAWFIKVSAVARISLACEPMISPILIIVRYDSLRSNVQSMVKSSAVFIKQAATLINVRVYVVRIRKAFQRVPHVQSTVEVEPIPLEPLSWHKNEQGGVVANTFCRNNVAGFRATL